MTPSPGTMLRRAATIRSRRPRISASCSGIRTDIPCNSVMSKRRYQPFDALHIGLAKTVGNRGSGTGVLLVGRLPTSQRGARKMKAVLAAAMLVTATIQVAHAQDVAAGEQSFKKCLP